MQRDQKSHEEATHHDCAVVRNKVPVEKKIVRINHLKSHKLLPIKQSTNLAKTQVKFTTLGTEQGFCLTHRKQFSFWHALSKFF